MMKFIFPCHITDGLKVTENLLIIIICTFRHLIPKCYEIKTEVLY